jgi:DNA-binding NtrC family response regulator
VCLNAADSEVENSSGLGMTKGPGEADSLVVVVDDDASVRQALTSLLQSVGLRVEAFGSAADFLKKGRLADSVAAAFLTFDYPASAGSTFRQNLQRPTLICQSFSSADTATSQ